MIGLVPPQIRMSEPTLAQPTRRRGQGFKPNGLISVMCQFSMGGREGGREGGGREGGREGGGRRGREGGGREGEGVGGRGREGGEGGR